MSTPKKLFLEVHAPAPGAAPEVVSFDLGLEFSYRRQDRLTRVAEKLCGGKHQASTKGDLHRSDFAFITQRRSPYVWTGALPSRFRLFFFTNV